MPVAARTTHAQITVDRPVPAKDINGSSAVLKQDNVTTPRSTGLAPIVSVAQHVCSDNIGIGINNT